MAYSEFEKEYKIAINNILRDLYRGTEYWGVGPAGNEGIIKPITDSDDPDWSYYNFINTHYSVRDKVVNPALGDLPIEMDKKHTESDVNREYFRALWKNRREIFGPDSTYKDRIIDAVSKTRKQGTEREFYVALALKSIRNIEVDTVAQAGGTEDFKGTDLKIISNNDFVLPSGTAQVKSFRGLTKNEEFWFVDTDLRRKYTTNYMIFGKISGMEYHVAVFINNPDDFTFLSDGKLAIPKEDCKLLINYNLITKKSVYKSMDSRDMGWAWD